MKAEKKTASSAKRQQQHQQQQQQQQSSAVQAGINSTAASAELPASSAEQQQQAKLAQKQQQPIPHKHMFSESAMRNNFQVLEQSRTCQAAVTGIASGILGLTGAIGFIFYFLSVFIQALIWDYKAGFQWANFFPTRWLVLTHSLVGGLFTYVLFWVFVYGLVHVY